MKSIKNFIITNKLYIILILLVYIVSIVVLQVFTTLTLNDSLFWLGLTSLLLSFFTSVQSRASLTKMFRFADFRTHGVNKHAKEVLDGEFGGLMEKESDTFYIPFSIINLSFGILSFIICLLMYLL